MYTGCNLKTIRSLDCALTGVCVVIPLDCALIGVCVVIRSNTKIQVCLYSKLTLDD